MYNDSWPLDLVWRSDDSFLLANRSSKPAYGLAVSTDGAVREISKPRSGWDFEQQPALDSLPVLEHKETVEPNGAVRTEATIVWR